MLQKYNSYEEVVAENIFDITFFFSIRSNFEVKMNEKLLKITCLRLKFSLRTKNISFCLKHNL